MTRLSAHFWRPGEGDREPPRLDGGPRRRAADPPGDSLADARSRHQNHRRTAVQPDCPQHRRGQRVSPGATGRPTSIRPPLYPAMLAGIWSVVGIRQPSGGARASRFSWRWRRRRWSTCSARESMTPRVGRWAAAVCWLYPSFIFFNFLILTETLFTLLLVAFVLAHGPAGADAARLARRRVRCSRWASPRSRAAFSGRCRSCCVRCWRC